MLTTYDDRMIERFWKHVDKRGPDDCWEWTGARLPKGYGQFQLGLLYGTIRTHVFCFRLLKGPTNGLCVCHSCDNPPCCNPAHLWLGTNSDNQRDRARKGRYAKVRPEVAGEKNGNTRLSNVQVREIKADLQKGFSARGLGRKYGVSRTTISNIRKNFTWSTVSWP